MNDHKKIILRALERLRGDDAERARQAFRGMTEKQMDCEYGLSGKTRREILADYESHEAQIEAAIEWLKEVA